jgi:xylan 1,4-beta-xylosidase
LNRRIALQLNGLWHADYRARVARVDATHSNVLAGYPAGTSWPDAQLWRQLRAADRLDEQPLPPPTVVRGTAEFALDLPMPGVARLRLTPARMPARDEEGPR